MHRRQDYRYELPPALIAQRPSPRRDGSRLLVVEPGGALADVRFPDIVDRLPADAVLVVNDARVVPARLRCRKPTGGAVELLFLDRVAGGSAGPGRDGGELWRCLARSSKPLRAGTRLQPVPRGASRRRAAGGRSDDEPAREAAGAPAITIAEGRPAPPPDGSNAPGGLAPGTLGAPGAGERGDGPPPVLVHVAGDVHALLAAHGELPLPPYIRRPDGLDADDGERYQTVYARAPGAIAAPTAGLHFSPELLGRLEARGVTVAPLTLHVGVGTFAPLRADALSDHRMHVERYDIPARTAALVGSGRPVVAVGTTAVRALESAAGAGSAAGGQATTSAAGAGSAAGGQATTSAAGGQATTSAAGAGGEPRAVRAGPGETDLFIRPGHRFRAVDHLITNFHLPESTLLVLVCAFAGHDRVMAAYRHAVAAGYRFFSYGDAMLLSRAPEAATR